MLSPDFLPSLMLATDINEVWCNNVNINICKQEISTFTNMG